MYLHIFVVVLFPFCSSSAAPGRRRAHVYHCRTNNDSGKKLFFGRRWTIRCLWVDGSAILDWMSADIVERSNCLAWYL